MTSLSYWIFFESGDTTIRLWRCLAVGQPDSNSDYGLFYSCVQGVNSPTLEIWSFPVQALLSTGLFHFPRWIFGCWNKASTRNLL